MLLYGCRLKIYTMRGGEIMTNTYLLREKIASLGLKYIFIAEQLGLTVQSLQRKIENLSEFKASEIQSMCKILRIDDSNEKEDIFFA